MNHTGVSKDVLLTDWARRDLQVTKSDHVKYVNLHHNTPNFSYFCRLPSTQPSNNGKKKTVSVEEGIWRTINSVPVVQRVSKCMYRVTDPAILLAFFFFVFRSRKVLRNVFSTNRGSSVVKVLRYKSEGRWFDANWCQWIFHWYKILPIALYGSGVDSASNKYEYQGHFLGVKAAGALGWQPTTILCRCHEIWETLTSWNPLGHSRLVKGLLYLLSSMKHAYQSSL